VSGVQKDHRISGTGLLKGGRRREGKTTKNRKQKASWRTEDPTHLAPKKRRVKERFERKKGVSR